MNDGIITLTLEQIKSFFDDEGFFSKVIPASETTPIDQLFVDFADSKDRDSRLEIILLPENKGVYVIQFFVILPFKIQKKDISDIARLMIMINNNLPITGFGMIEEQSLPYFRYLLSWPEIELNKDVIVKTAWMIDYLINRLGGILESFAKGEKTIDEAIFELKENTKKSPSR